MAQQLNEELGLDAELIRSSGGVFEVEYDGRLVFSKKKIGRFPKDGEVAGIIKKSG